MLSRSDTLIRRGSFPQGLASCRRLFGPVTVLIVLLFAFNPSARGAPAAPNKAVLTGTVREASGISSSELGGGVEQPFCKLVVRVETVTEVEGYANFLKEREGRYITVYSNGRCPSELAGRRIRATVSYEGDERDGLFLMESLDGVK